MMECPDDMLDFGINKLRCISDLAKGRHVGLPHFIYLRPQYAEVRD